MSMLARQFRNLVLAVFDTFQLKLDRSSQNAAIGQVHSHVSSKYPSIKREELEKFLPEGARLQSDGAQGRRVFIYLEPPEKAATSLPVLNLSCDFTNPNPDVGIRLAFFLLDKDKTPVSIGFRFETPHGANEDEGLHDYYHAQPINSFFKGGQHLLNCPPWLPCKLPAFPLWAQDPVELLSCLLLSLYGPLGIRKVMETGRSDKSLQDLLGKFMNDMEVIRQLRVQAAKKGAAARSKKGARGQ